MKGSEHSNMKILLTTLNSKYVHSNPALKYLYTVVAGEHAHVDIREFTVNNDPNYIFQEIVRANYEVVCFSCYVWNIEQIKILAADIKLAAPKTKILLGGPEVSFRGYELMARHPWIDYILSGEGEYEFYRFCQVLESPERNFETVPGLTYRQGKKIYVNGDVEPMDFNLIPFPYSILDCEGDKVVYYESTRGCPFNCSYCLSSIEKNLRVLDMDRVRRELGYFLYKKVPQVKFIDRTFNFDRQRAKEIFQYIISMDNGITNFHTEICADLLDEETFRILSKARKGLFQFEIGVQSTNRKTLKAINRHSDTVKILRNIKRLVSMGNIAIHADLIAGLPYETYEIFARSFDEVYAAKAHNLQLGFLKVLKGTPMEEEAGKYGVVYRKHAPYEVISTDFISVKEIIRLKAIENMLDIFYNRGGFAGTLEYLIAALGKGAFAFYEALADYYYEAGYQNRDRKKEDQYRIMLGFAKYLADQGIVPEAEVRVAETLDKDLLDTMNPENYKRFIRKGWNID